MSAELAKAEPPQAPPIGIRKTPLPSIIPCPEWYSATHASKPYVPCQSSYCSP
ncbi:hypothetical protein [Amycolatopsis sp. cmx-4-83]|uniref:hypothetical protein n=1 Tax=Amycolatopsis sp. cmx-4-83 TaxID=2790940 RepID=UPI00397B6E78